MSLPLVAPLLAQEKRQGLRVLCDIGCYSVVADAAVCELVGVAAVLSSGTRCRAGSEADELCYD